MKNPSFNLLLYLFWETFPTLFHRFSNKYKTASYLYFVVTLLLLQVPFATIKSTSPKTGCKKMHFRNEYTFLTIKRFSYLIHNRTLEHILHSSNICSSLVIHTSIHLYILSDNTWRWVRSCPKWSSRGLVVPVSVGSASSPLKYKITLKIKKLKMS
jgi:hypothetical protein